MIQCKGRVLVVDDDAKMGELLRDFLEEEGYEVETALSGQEGLAKLKENDFEVLITDLEMKGMRGMELLAQAQTLRPELKVIMITAFGTIESAIQAMKLGAYDYITKPFKMEEILLGVGRALEEGQLRREVARLRQEVKRRYGLDNLLGKSKAMQEVFDLLLRVKDSSSHILITGESGTGKELVARAIHYNSQWREGPFVPINCAAIPETLLESELFGYVKGAFTDARSDKKGLFEEAHGGTILLDEIAELSQGLQAKLLRVIQEREVRRIGSTRPTPIEVRVIATTNVDLEEAVKEKAFREDLYYRLNVIRFDLPPLRERKEDIPLLACHFLKKHAESTGKSFQGISEEALKRMLGYSWPGNVRELENALERAVAIGKGPIVHLGDLPEGLSRQRDSSDFLEAAADKGLTIEELEREYILKVLEQAGWNKARAAKLLGLDRTTLYRKLERYGKAS